MSKKWYQYVMIPAIDWIYIEGIARNMSQLEKWGVKSYFTEVLTVLEKYNCKLYFHKDEFQSTQKEIVKKVIENIEWADDFNFRLEKNMAEYFTIAQELEKTNLSDLNNEKLAEKWQKLNYYKEECHVMGVVTTWILDEDDQPFSNYLLNILKNKIKGGQISELFTILTTPSEKSEVQKEEIEILKKIKETGGNFKINDAQEIADKMGWLYYRFLGPGKSAAEYYKDFEELAQKGIDPDKEIAKIDEEINQTKEKQKMIENELRLNEKEKKYFRFAREIVKIKDFRKSTQFFGSYINDKLLEETAKRLGVKFESIRQILPQEFSEILSGKKVNEYEMAERFNYSVLLSQKGENNLTTGDKAREFMAGQEFEQDELDNVTEIKGMCASPGQSNGIVKIIDTLDQLGKIDEGDIMVSHATYPDLVPAMKKASAIITEEGGLVCHAAIVSRELKKPCIVGTKIATKVLKDGDMVEVDADAGIIRII